MKIQLACIALVFGAVAPSTADDFPSSELLAGSYMVRASGEAGLDVLLEAIAVYTADPDAVTVIPLLPQSDIYHIIVPEVDSLIGDQIDNEIEELTDGETLIWSEADYLVGHDDNEGQSGSLWVSGLGLTASQYKNQYAFDHLKLDEARKKSGGEGVCIAILDTKPDLNHPKVSRIYKVIDLVDLSGGGATDGEEGGLLGNGIDEDGDGIKDESLGHGTFVTALAQTAAPSAGILSVTVLNDDGIGSAATLALGISMAVDEGAHIISLSLGSENESLAVASVIDYALESGVTVFAAVGNTGTWGCLFPARHPGVIGVGATDFDRNLGAVSSFHDEMDVTAPGVSNLIFNEGESSRLLIGPTRGTEYVAGTGTSFSTALAAGVGAAIRAQLLDLEVEQIPLGQVASRIKRRLGLSPSTVEIPNDSGQLRAIIDADDATNYSDPVPEDSDINGDGATNGQDLALVLGKWGLSMGPGGLHREDMERDGVIDGQDLARLLGGWGSP